MIMTGCSKENKVENSSTETNESEGTDTTEKDESESVKKELITLTYYYMGDTQPDEALVEEEMNKILVEKINAKIDLIATPGDSYENKIKLMAGTQETFDLCFTSSWALNYVSNSSDGIFADITDLLPTKAPELWASMKAEWWDAARVNGKIYGVMNQQIFARQSGFWYDDVYIQKYSQDPNELNTFRKFADYLLMLKENEPAENTTYMTWKLECLGQLKEMKGWENVSGSDVPGSIMSDGSNTTIFNEYATPEYRELVFLAKELQEKGVIAKDVLTAATIDRTQLKASPAMIAPGNAESEARNNGMEKIVMVPVGNASLTTNNVTATMTAVSATSRDIERSVELLNLINTDKELYNLLCHGIEGKHYTKVGDNKWAPIQNSQYNPNSDWMFGCVFNSLIQEASADDLWEQTKEINNNAQVSVLMGFVFDNSQIKTEEVNCKAVIDEYRDTFAAGLYGDDTEAKYNEFLDKLNAAGLDKVLAEKQKQVDAFLGK
jgi:putative aldouronate transport system substrate-binding protein